ncbi:STAS domain-containing protein [Paractinoplanes ferrugineus]|uniref:Anti-anti-sigma factor n=1 Tax=Paractinoplanes ferrugineus TaxID=113564 RepID=A0A919J6G7_9ACTN|nr:STAS domain-containing protein [Actinoplanes ferrugineus]GIE11481.1 anti-anti-sigma factor [Actinoplanes ferrugineus]
MSTPLTFTTGGTDVLAAAGEIDMSNAATFAAALREARQTAGTAVLTVDLTGVDYIDSAGLAALFPHVEHVRVVANPLLAPVLTIAGLDELTTIRE